MADRTVRPLSPPTSSHRLAAVAPFLFLVHDLEEALQADRMTRLATEAGGRLPAPIGSHLSRMRYGRGPMAVFSAVAFAVQVGATLWSRRSPRGRLVLRTLLAARLLNAVTHLAESCALRRYVPGAATSPANLLVCGLLLRSMRHGAAPAPTLPHPRR